MTQKASNWLSDRLGGLRQKLEAAERALQQYREKERIVDVKGVAQSGASRQLEQLTTALVEARNRRNEAENRYNQIRGIRGTSASAYESVPAVMNNPMVGADAEDRGRRGQEAVGTHQPLRQGASAHGPGRRRAQGGARKHPPRAIETVVASITREYEVARANEAVDRAQPGASPRARSRTSTARNSSSACWSAKWPRTSSSTTCSSGASRKPAPPATCRARWRAWSTRPFLRRRPTSRTSARSVLIALVVGLFVGVMLALLLERLDSTVKTSHDVESKLGLPVLAIAADHHRRKGRQARAHLRGRPAGDILRGHPHRAHRRHAFVDRRAAPQRCVVTSSVPGEGKTTFATNLALAFAQTKRVVLVDADMRRPSIGKLFGKEQHSPGLSQPRGRQARRPRSAFSRSRDSGSTCCPSGAVPPNPLELLLSQAVRGRAAEAARDVRHGDHRFAAGATGERRDGASRATAPA